MNTRDKLMGEEFINDNFTLSQVKSFNEPECTFWASRRHRVDNILVWEFNFFITSANYLLRFPRKDDFCNPIEIIYLPEAVIRRCHIREECCSGHPFVIEIVTHKQFLRTTEGKLISEKLKALYLSFENIEELCGSIAFLSKIGVRQIRSAAITFGNPLRVDHRIHLNAKYNEKNFGFGLLPLSMREWLLKQGLTVNEVSGNEVTILGCAKTLYLYQQRHGMPTNLPPIPIEEENIEENYNKKLFDQHFILPSALETITLDSLLSEGDPEILYINWEILDSGSQGDVFKAIRKFDKKEVAIKCITIRREKRDIPPLIKEVALLKAIKHPNIIKIYDCYRKEKKLYIIMELMDGGKLTDLLEPFDRKKIEFNEIQLATIMKEIFLALQFLHNSKCIHRDIKSDNILLSSHGEVKLGDFGFATSLKTNKGTRQTVVGTPYWMAPEVASGMKYNNKADIWSAGILFIELCDGQPPLMGLNPMRALLKVSTGPPPSLKSAKKRSPLCKEFVSFLLVKDPIKRPSVDDALKHPFIATLAESSCQFIINMLKQRQVS